MIINGMEVTDEDLAAIKKAKSLAELVPIAEHILSRMRYPIMIIGPMTTGGKGELEANFRFHDAAVAEAVIRGQEVFYQSFFKEPMIQLLPNFWEMQKTELGRQECSRLIISEFYLPVFELGRIKTLFRLPEWESSVGTRMECDIATRLGQPALINYPTLWLPFVEERYQELSQAMVIQV